MIRPAQADAKNAFEKWQILATAADQKTLALSALACQLANAADGFGLFAGPLLGWLFVEIAHLHFTENAFALHLLFQSAQGLIYVVIADKYLHLDPVPSGLV